MFDVLEAKTMIIDSKTANEIAKWNKEHPLEAAEFAKFHEEQYKLFASHQISYKEFHRNHENWKSSQ